MDRLSSSGCYRTASPGGTRCSGGCNGNCDRARSTGCHDRCGGGSCDNAASHNGRCAASPGPSADNRACRNSGGHRAGRLGGNPCDRRAGRRDNRGCGSDRHSHGCAARRRPGRCHCRDTGRRCGHGHGQDAARCAGRSGARSARACCLDADCPRVGRAGSFRNSSPGPRFDRPACQARRTGDRLDFQPGEHSAHRDFPRAPPRLRANCCRCCVRVSWNRIAGSSWIATGLRAASHRSGRCSGRAPRREQP